MRRSRASSNNDCDSAENAGVRLQKRKLRTAPWIFILGTSGADESLCSVGELPLFDPRLFCIPVGLFVSSRAEGTWLRCLGIYLLWRILFSDQLHRMGSHLGKNTSLMMTRRTPSMSP